MKKRTDLQRFLSFAMVFAMIFAMLPVFAVAADGTTLFLKPNSNWQMDGARFAVYYFGNGDGWASMADADGDGIYEAVVPGGYENIIFCRMDPSSTENSWSSKWNQTADMTVPTDGTNLYTVADGTWDNGGGTWSVHEIPEEEDNIHYLKPNENWLKDGARFAAYYFGNGELWLDMTDEDGDGYYEVEIPEGYTSVIFCRMNPNAAANNWDNKWNQTADLTVPTNDDNCYTVEDGSWDNGGGTWSVYDPEEQATQPSVSAATYIVAGPASLCGSEWDAGDTANQMSRNADGTYQIVYKDVAVGSHSFKITDGTWNNSWGDGSQNYTFKVSAVCNVTIVFDPDTKEITVSGDGVGEITGLEVSSMTAVGNGSGKWLNGANWDVASAANAMTEVSDNVYELTMTGVPGGTGYQVKFAANGSWTDNWGGSYSGSGVATDAWYNSGDNITFDVTYETADVKLQLDLTGFNYSTKNGAKFTVTITEASGETEPSVDYYLAGWINGADLGIEGDAANLGSYKFENGKLTASFTADSYVVVKNGSNVLYMAESYCTDTTVTLKQGGGEKMFVPGNVELTFTLTENSDGTLTLSYVTAAAEPDVPQIPEGYTAVTIHFLKTEGWGANINGYVWTDSGAVPGYEDYNTWPGKAIAANATHPGWYDLIVATEEPAAFNFIFNDGGNQTADLTTGAVTGDTELWVIGNEVMTAAPGQWSGDYDYTAHIHFQKPENYGTTVNAYLWNDAGALPGYEEYNSWPGKAIEEDSINAGWYTVSVTMDDDTGFNFILNDGKNQTVDLTTGKLQLTTNIWVVDGVVQTTAPEGWVDPARKIYIPGTFADPTWDAASNQMTYDPELGLYVYTFQDVPTANYEYKIAVNGSWSENYGAGGVKDGSNIAVTVPEEMDVTVYYNDQTHYSVTNVNYVFADITLSGTGIPEGTKLTDKGLTGIYTATVDMAAGVYTDVKLTYNGKDYAFAEVEVEEDKAVTFYMDPVTGIFYNNASGEPIDPRTIYYNSQDIEYKSPFGAVATGEEVTFAIDTGADITSAVLVIGSESYPMTSAETEEGLRWTAVAAMKNIGEYGYYFAVSNGSTIAIYGDDDGCYGEGTVSDLTTVQPYDLVVYQDGFQTPDWMKNAVIYQIFPDRFFDGDESNNQAQTTARGEVDYEYVSDWYLLPENPEQEQMNPGSYPSNAFSGDGQWSNEIYGGDLEGIVDKIGYLDSLGVNVIYLNPVFSSISNHRYDACDYMEIDPILGTMGDFEELVAAADAYGMHIILDGVFNHVSDDSVYFDRYYKFLGTSEKIGAYPYWAYVYDYMAENGVDQETAVAAAKKFFSVNYGITDWSYTEWFEVYNRSMAGAVDNIGLRAGKAVYAYDGWWGYDSMPIIYSTNGSEYRTGNWAQEIIYNPDGTSATQFWLSKGSDGWRLDVANEVSDETWINFRGSVKAMGSDNVIIGEIWDDATHYLLGNMYDSVMNYVFRNNVTGFAMGTDAETTTKEMEKLRERYPEEAFYAMMNLVGSHDTSRILSYLDGIGDDRADKTPAAAYPTYATTSTLAKNRQYLVAFLQFTYAGAPTVYYGDEIGMVGSDDPDDRRAFEWGKGNQELVEWYATLAAIREAYSALRTGSVEAFAASSNVMGYVRRDTADTLIVLANNSSSGSTVKLDLTELNVEAETLTDLITGDSYTVTDGTVTVNVDALRGAILTANVKEITVNTAGLAAAYNGSVVGSRSETAPSVGYTTQDGQTVTIGDTLDFSVDALVNTFVGVTINGETVDPADYDMQTGTVITLSAELIEKLGVGEHSIAIVFEGGTAEAEFTVEKAPEETTEPTEPEETTEPTAPEETTEPTDPSEEETEPSEEETTKPTSEPDKDNAKTGDESGIQVWLLVMFLSLIALTILIIVMRKHKKD